MRVGSKREISHHPSRLTSIFYTYIYMCMCVEDRSMSSNPYFKDNIGYAWRKVSPSEMRRNEPARKIRRGSRSTLLLPLDAPFIPLHALRRLFPLSPSPSLSAA